MIKSNGKEIDVKSIKVVYSNKGDIMLMKGKYVDGTPILREDSSNFIDDLEPKTTIKSWMLDVVKFKK